MAGLVGTSMGAVVAALVGSRGGPRSARRFCLRFPWGESPRSRSLRDWAWPMAASALAALDLLTKGKTFAELDPVVWVVATDLEAGTPVILREGPVAPAVRASISVPGVFAPYRLDGRGPG